MGKSYTLEEYREALSSKYAPLTIGGVEFPPYLCLPQKARTAIVEIGEKMSGAGERDGERALAGMRDILIMIGGDGAERLLEALGDTPAVWSEIFQTWQRETRLGEAQPSAD